MNTILAQIVAPTPLIPTPSVPPPTANVPHIVYWGSGSEWFWAFLQLLVIVAGIVLTLRQLSINRQANLIALLKNLDNRWFSEKMVTARSKVCLSRSNGSVSVSNEEDYVLVFFEDLGLYYKRGIFDLSVIWDTYSIYIEFYWPILKPKVEEQWAKGDRTYYSNFKLLYDKVCRMTKKNKGGSVDKTQGDIDDFATSEIERIEAIKSAG